IDVVHARVLDDVIPDLADVRGQQAARVALEVAASGFHHMLMVGPPGAGKSMLARRLPGLLPRLTDDEAFSCAMVRSAAGMKVTRLLRIARLITVFRWWRWSAAVLPTFDPGN
ncbi:MAG: hypothetical protein RJA15_1400, partial [Actinomycetota bacterium]